MTARLLTNDKHDCEEKRRATAACDEANAQAPLATSIPVDLQGPTSAHLTAHTPAHTRTHTHRRGCAARGHVGLQRLFYFRSSVGLVAVFVGRRGSRWKYQTLRRAVTHPCRHTALPPPHLPPSGEGAVGPHTDRFSRHEDGRKGTVLDY